MKFLALVLATAFVATTASADYGIKPPSRGSVDTTIGTNPPSKGGRKGQPGIGDFERKQWIKLHVEAAAKNSGLNKIMKQDQPNDLKNLKATLEKAALQDADAHEIILDIANASLPRDPQKREEVQFDMQMTLTLLAGQYGYEEQDN